MKQAEHERRHQADGHMSQPEAEGKTKRRLVGLLVFLGLLAFLPLLLSEQDGADVPEDVVVEQEVGTQIQSVFDTPAQDTPRLEPPNQTAETVTNTLENLNEMLPQADNSPVTGVLVKLDDTTPPESQSVATFDAYQQGLSLDTPAPAPQVNTPKVVIPPVAVVTPDAPITPVEAPVVRQPAPKPVRRVQPKPPVKPPAPVDKRRWYVQMGNFSAAYEAQNIQSEVRSMSMQVQQINRGTSVGLLVGPFADKGRAIQSRRRLQTRLGINGAVIQQ